MDNTTHSIESFATCLNRRFTDMHKSLVEKWSRDHCGGYESLEEHEYNRKVYAAAEQTIEECQEQLVDVFRAIMVDLGERA